MLTRSAISKVFDDVDSRELLTEALQYACKLGLGLVPDRHDDFLRAYISLSQGRKVFRLFKFVPELIKVSDTDSRDILSLLKGGKHIAIAVFLLMDHYVWLLQSALAHPRTELSPPKSMKHRAALIASVLGALIDLIEMQRIVQKERERAEKSKEIRTSCRIALHVLRFWLTLHKLNITLVGRQESWGPVKAGLIGLTTACLGLWTRIDN